MTQHTAQGAKCAPGQTVAHLRWYAEGMGAEKFAPPEDDRRLARTLEAIRDRCAANAEIARTDPDRRRVTVSVALRTAEQRRDLR